MLPGQAKDWDTHGKLGPLSRAIGEAEEPRLARAEGTWKMGQFMVFSQQLVMQVTLELRTLLKVMPKVHPEL